MEENEKSGLLDKAMPVVEPQDLGTCYRAAAHMAALAGTAVVPPRRRTPLRHPPYQSPFKK